VSSKAAMTAFTATMALFNGASAVATVRTDSLGMSYTTMATRATVGATAIRGLNGAMAMLGGPAGIIMLAAGALYYFYEQSQQAKQGAIDFADGLDVTTTALQKMTAAQQAATEAKLEQAIDAQKEKVSDLKSEVDSLTARYQSGTSASGNYQLSQEQLAKLHQELIIKTADLETESGKLSTMNSKLYAIQSQLRGAFSETAGVLQSYGGSISTVESIQRQFNSALGITNTQLKTQSNYVMLLAGQKGAVTEAGLKALKAQEDELAVLRESNPLRKVEIKARQEAEKLHLSEAETLSYVTNEVAKYNQETANSDAKKALEDQASAAKKAAEEFARTKKSASEFYVELSRLGATDAQDTRNWAADKTAQLKAFYQAGTLSAQQYKDGVLMINKEMNDRLAKQDADRWSKYTQGSQSQLFQDQRAAQSLTGAKGNIIRANIATDIKSATFSGLPTIDAGS
jgi:hypothetical protein